MQRVIELTFADEDVRIVAVGDGDRAIAELARAAPDIVLADTGMPGKTGYDVAEYIRASPHLAHIPVVLLAGAFETVDEARAGAARCDGVVRKPFEPQLVIRQVKELLENPRPMAPPALRRPDEDQARLHEEPEKAGEVDVSQLATEAYFDRLDAAFASLEAPGPAAGRPGGAAARRSGQPENDPRKGTAVAVRPLEAAESVEIPLTLSEQDVERIVRRVLDAMSDRIVREVAREAVAEIAERLVVEEIERIKTTIK